MPNTEVDPAPPSHPAPAARHPGPARRWAVVGRHRAVVAVTAVLLVPLLVSAVVALVRDEMAVHGDDALIELRVRDVGGPDTPLLGSFQRFGFRMPGPLLFYLLAVPYRLAGADFAGLQLGALLLNAAAVVAIVAVVHHRFGAVPAVWTAAVVAVLLRAQGHLGVTDPWEPRITMLPFLLLVLLAAVLVSGSTGTAWALPLAAAVGTLLVQSQVTLAPTVVALLAGAGAVVAVRAVRAEGGAGPAVAALRRPLVATAAVLGVLWLPPVLHDLTAEVSNVGEMLAFLRSEQEQLGLGPAVRAMALQLGVPALWMTGRTQGLFGAGTVDLAAAPAVPVALLALVAATALAARRGARPAAVLGATVLATVVIGTVVLGRLVGDLFDWILFWTWALGAAVWIATGTCAWLALPDHHRQRLARPVVAVLAVAVAGLSVSTSAAAPSDEPADTLRVRAGVLRLADETAAALGDVDGPVHVRSDAVVPEHFMLDNVGVEFMVLALERRGFETRVDPQHVDRFGTHRVDGEPAAEVYLVTDGGRTAGPAYEEVGRVELLTDADRAELARLERRLREAGHAGIEREDLADHPGDGALEVTVAQRDRLRGYPDLTVLVRR